MPAGAWVISFHISPPSGGWALRNFSVSETEIYDAVKNLFYISFISTLTFASVTFSAGLSRGQGYICE